MLRFALRITTICAMLSLVESVFATDLDLEIVAKGISNGVGEYKIYSGIHGSPICI
jgi:hypothetical protein